MAGVPASGPDWTVADEGWGRKAVDFATLSEPANCREYVALHHMLGVDNGDRLLDVACGAGLAIELASVRGADCAGIDASPRLVAVARDRSPRADIRVGDMHALPWDDGGFTVVTSFRGIWGTAPAALEEVWRVRWPRLDRHTRPSSTSVSLRSPRRPCRPRPLRCETGCRCARKLTWSDTSAASRIRIRPARDRRGTRHREITMTRRHTAPREITMTSASDMAGATKFLDRADVTEKVQALFDEDLAELGFVMNASRLWAYQPEAMDMLFSLMSRVASARPFTFRERGILVAACASALGDSYCSLAWGTKLAAKADAQLAAGVLRGDDGALTEAERAMAAWARRITGDPNGTSTEDMQELRDAGFSDADIFAMTVYVALRIALSTVNDALGARPDAEYRTLAPAPVRDAVTFGRPVDASPQPPGSAQRPRDEGG